MRQNRSPEEVAFEAYFGDDVDADYTWDDVSNKYKSKYVKALFTGWQAGRKAFRNALRSMIMGTD